MGAHLALVASACVELWLCSCGAFVVAARERARTHEQSYSGAQCDTI